MRVLELSPFHETCGIATYGESLVDALREAGARVDVLAPVLRYGVRVRGVQPPRLWNLQYATRADALRTYLEVVRRRARVVHLQISPGLFSAPFLRDLWQLCRLGGVPVVATLHSRMPDDAIARAELQALLEALEHAALVVHNRQHAAELGRERVHVIAHGVGLPQDSDPARARQALGLDPERRVIAHFGFLHPDKGVEEVLGAVAELRRRAYPDLFFWVSGGTFPIPASQAYLARLRALAAELGLAEHVNIAGEFRSHERAVHELQAADWVVLNYRTGNNQGTSGAARHALVSGRPLAVSPAPVFDDLRAAAWTLTGELTDALDRMLADEQLARDTAGRAWRYCVHHSWANVAARHLDLFERAASRWQPPWRHRAERTPLRNP